MTLRTHITATIVVTLLAAGGLRAQSEWSVPEVFKTLPSYVRVPIFPPLKDEAGLPRVLLIGDSISMYYTPQVRLQLAGKANVYRVPDNGKTTRYGLENMKYWLGDGNWKVIHFNFGLHDLAGAEKRQVPIDEYERNLRELVKILSGTGAKLIWASTTPVPEGSRNRKEADALAYNAVAQKVMEENRVPVNDLHRFIETRPKKENLALPADVHYRAEGSVELGIEVARHILEALGR